MLLSAALHAWQSGGRRGTTPSAALWQHCTTSRPQRLPGPTPCPTPCSLRSVTEGPAAATPCMFEQCAIIVACGVQGTTPHCCGVGTTSVPLRLAASCLTPWQPEVGALIKQLTGTGCCCCAMTLFFCMPGGTLSHLTFARVAWGTLTHTLQMVRVLLHRKKAAAVALADPSPCECLAVCLTPRHRSS